MKKCPKCGYSLCASKYSTNDDYKRLPFNKFMAKTLKRASERMKKELGYGIPENITKHDPEDLGNVITGEWRQYDNQKDN